MYSALKIFARKSKSEDGFVLIIALIAVMILIAVGFYALTVASKDIFIASRLIGERKAFSAAEAGVHAISLTFDPAMAALANQSVDPTDDPKLKYSVAKPERDTSLSSIPVVGADITYGKDWIYQVYKTNITGTDLSYGSSETIAVGFQFGPVPNDPTYR